MRIYSLLIVLAAIVVGALAMSSTGGSAGTTLGAPTTITIPHPHTDGTVASVGNKVLFAGGASNNYQDISDIVDIYDASTGQWTTASLSQPRHALASVTLGTKVFFAGGQYNPAGDDSTRVDIYDSQTNSWSATELSEPRHYPSVVAVNGKVIIAGGWNSSGERSTYDIYDVGAGTWTSGNLPTPTSGDYQGSSVGALALIADHDEVNIYDSQSSTWLTPHPLSVPRTTIAATTLGTKVIFAGGQSPSGNDAVDIFNAQTSQWQTATLSQARFTSPVTFNNRAYFIGGWTGSAASATIDVYDGSSWTVDSLPSASWGDGPVVAGGKLFVEQFGSSVLVYGPPASSTITVPASQPWTDTNIDLTVGSGVSISASGTIYIAGSDPGKTPAGAPGCVATADSSIPPGPFIAPGLTCWSLIGRIGNAGAPFEVGVGTCLSVTEPGRLFLGVDDNFFGDNSGSWTAVVSAVPPTPLAPTCITAHAYGDANQNGAQDAGELSLAGWTMSLYQGDGCAGSALTSLSTDGSGNAVFGGLTPGDYSVGETVQPGRVSTTGLCHYLTALAGQPTTTNFGNVQFTYVATGDSYPAGSDLESPGTSDPFHAYPMLVDLTLNQHLGDPGFWGFSCDGDTTAQYIDASRCVEGGSQLNVALAKHPNLVTITVGADDFLGPLIKCLSLTNIIFSKLTGCVKKVLTGPQAERDWSALKTNLNTIVANYLASPGTLVVLTNYPFPGKLDCSKVLTLLPKSCAQINKQLMPLLETNFIDRLNTTIAGVGPNSLDPTRVVLADVRGQFRGHEYYSASSWFSQAAWSIWFVDVPVPYGVHPNVAGQQCIASVVWEVSKVRLGSSEPPSADACP